jgi:pimeloyl-ACP methyl ester carboxylesterase
MPPSAFFHLWRTGVEAVAARLAFFPPTPSTYDVLPSEQEKPTAIARRRADADTDVSDDTSSSGSPRPLYHDCPSPAGAPGSRPRRPSNSFLYLPPLPGSGGLNDNDNDNDGGGDSAEDAAHWPGGDGEHRRRRRLNGRRLEIVPTLPGAPCVHWPDALVSYVRVPKGVPRGAGGGGATVAGGYDIVVAFVPFYLDDDDEEENQEQQQQQQQQQPSAGGEDNNRANDQSPPQNGASSSPRQKHRRRARATILFSHGNAQDLGTALPFARDVLSKHLKANVICYDYAGYGRSGGLPGVSSTLADIAAALRHARERYGVKESDVVLYGQSVGTGPSVWLAARRSTARQGWVRECERAARRAQRAAVRAAAEAAGAAGGEGGGSSSGGGGGNSTTTTSTLSAALALQRALRAGSTTTSTSGAGGENDAAAEDNAADATTTPPPGVAGLVLHSPIASGVRTLAPGLRHWPAGLDVFPNAQLIRRVTCCPTLVIHGTSDGVVPASAGVRLAELAPRPSLPPLFVPGAGHDDVELSALYLPRLRRFISECFPDCAEYRDWAADGGGGGKRGGGNGGGKK